MNNKIKILGLLLVFALIGGSFGAVGGFLFAYLKTDSSIEAGVLPNLGDWLKGSEIPGFNDLGIVPSYEEMVVAAVEKASPSVVSIVVSKDVPVIEQYFANPFENLPPEFKDFFGGFDFQVPQERQNGTERREIGGGSGFIVSEDGLIITNKHVVNDIEADYSVFTSDGKKYEAKVLARDKFNDLALLRIEASDLPVLSMGDSNKIKMGQTAIAIGYALAEFNNTVSVGVVSGLSRSIAVSSGLGAPIEELEDIIQTDAAINFGNSGGPLLNIYGEVIGINVAKADSAQNIGFALPVNLAKGAIDSYNKYGKITAPYLGVWYTPIDEEIKGENDLSVDYGILLKKGDGKESAIMEGSPAEKSGLKDGDVVLEFNEERIDKNTTLSSLIKKYQPESEVKLKVLRNRQILEISVVLGQRPEDL